MIHELPKRTVANNMVCRRYEDTTTKQETSIVRTSNNVAINEEIMFCAISITLDNVLINKEMEQAHKDAQQKTQRDLRAWALNTVFALSTIKSLRGRMMSGIY